MSTRSARHRPDAPAPSSSKGKSPPSKKPHPHPHSTSKPSKPSKPPAPTETPAPPTPPKRKPVDHAKRLRTILSGLCGLLLLVIVTGSLLIYITHGHNILNVTAPLLGSRPYFSWGSTGDDPTPEEIRETVLFHVSNMNFTPQNILQFLNGSSGVPAFFNVEQNRLYCAIPRDSYEGVNDFNLLTDHPEFIERAKREDDRLVLGDYHLKDIHSVFFSLPVEDLRIDPEAVIEINYPSATYSLRLEDLVQYYFNRNMYGTFYLNQCRRDPDRLRGKPLPLPAFVVYPGEPSLEALAAQLTGEDYSIEKRAQHFLDFVTREIRPDQDMVKSCDQIKKVNEVLMTGSCGLQEAVILYASLLEQTEIDYLIVYTDDAASILVEGDYPLQRGALVMHINGKSYHLADPTRRHFVMGQPAGPDWQAKNIRYVQRAGINSKTFSVETGEPSG
ncbi:MAG: hypothetical protein PHG65_04210 [Kiritimatiellae bacterium]|nr:hypothetical protein [Kiritimatiellia bacterium]